MITVFVVPLILSFAPVAVWTLRVGGLRRLWLLCALALLADLLAALMFSAVYAVPSVWRVVLYFLALVGPSILFTAVFLTLGSGYARILPLQLVVAFAGNLIGLSIGFVVTVYGQGVW